MDRSGASVARVIEQIEAALVIAYDDWLKELARAIRGEASPEHGAEFASKILDRPDATARRIYDELDRLGLVVDIGKRYKVLDRVFASTPNIMDAIHDLFTCIKRELKKQPRPKRPPASGIYGERALALDPESRAAHDGIESTRRGSAALPALPAADAESK